MLVDDDGCANRLCLRVRQSEPQVHAVCREIGTDSGTLVMITEPANECDFRAKMCRRYQRRCDVSSRLSLPPMDAALVVCRGSINVEQIIDRGAADSDHI